MLSQRKRLTMVSALLSLVSKWNSWMKRSRCKLALISEIISPQAEKYQNSFLFYFCVIANYLPTKERKNERGKVSFFEATITLSAQESRDENGKERNLQTKLWPSNEKSISRGWKLCDWSRRIQALKQTERMKELREPSVNKRNIKVFHFPLKCCALSFVERAPKSTIVFISSIKNKRKKTHRSE